MSSPRLPTSFWFIFAATAVARLGFFVESFLTIYMKAEAGFSAGAAAFLMALYGFGGAATAFLSGPLIDRFGARRPMLISLLLTAGAAVLLALGPPDWMLAVLVLLMGTVGQVIMPATNSHIAQSVPRPQQRRAFSMIYIALNSGLALGPLIGGWLAGVSFPLMFLVGAALIVAGSAFVLLSNRASRLSGAAAGAPVRVSRPFAALREVVRDRVFMRFMLLNWMFMGLYLQVFVILPLFMLGDGLSAQDYGIVMGANGILLVIAQLPTDRAVSRFSSPRLLTASSLVLMAGMLLNFNASTIWLYLLAAVFWTLAELINIPLAASVTAALGPDHLKGSYLAVLGVAFPMGIGIASLVGGSAFMLLGDPKQVWLILAALALLLGLLRLLQERSLGERIAREQRLWAERP